MMIIDRIRDTKVYAAALFGFSFPGLNVFLENIEPLLKALVLVGQFGVAAITVLYIYSKWKSHRNEEKDDE